jgi:PAS domain S-box-containing protein
MAAGANGYRDSVFAQADQRASRAVGLRSIALAGMAFAVVPLLLLLGLAWFAGYDLNTPAQMRWVMAGIGLIIVLYTGALGWLGVRWIGRPLHELAKAMNQIEHGDYPRTTGLADARLREVQHLHRGLQLMWRGLERRRNERDAALLASDAARQQMHTVLDQMDEGFMIADRSWNLKFCNQRAAQLVDKSGAGLDGVPFWDLFPDETQGGRRASTQREVEHDHPFVVEDFHERYGRWFEIRFFPLRDGIAIFLRDVSERGKLMAQLVEREQRYRELFEANPNVMWIFDTETLRFLAVNSAAVRRYGYSQEEFLAMKITDIRPEEDAEELVDEVHRNDARKHRPNDDEVRIWRHVTKSGQVVLVEITRHPIHFEGRAARLIMVNDATERLLSESRMRRRHEKLATQNGESVRALSASRQVMAGYARLVNAEVIPVLSALQARADADPLAQRAQELEQVLRQVQSWMLLPRARFSVETVQLSELAQAEIQKLRLAEPQRRVHVEIEPQLVCEGDAVLIKSLLQALLDNAWKFSARGQSPWIRMGRLQRPDAPEAAFFISDNGIGFDEAIQGRAYLPFERLHSEGEYSGYGLGLAVARAVVARHGGKLWAESSPGQGATFCFELAPRADNGALRVSEVVIDSLPPQDEQEESA